MTNQRIGAAVIAVSSAWLVVGLSACSDTTSTKSTTATAPVTPGVPGAGPLSGPTQVVDPGDGGNYAPDIDPSRFVDTIDNPLMPFTPGSRWVLEGTSDGVPERVEVIVQPERKDVMGISTVVVRDTVTVDGEVIEDTYDWYAQDVDGNVWYFGEDVKDYENGVVVSTGGSWEAGVDGALPGIVMPAQPSVGDTYRQEYLVGEAEDMFEVLSVNGTVTVPAGTYDAVITTEDWTPLEAEVIEHKQYAPGVGPIRSENVAGGDALIELIEYTPGT